MGKNEGRRKKRKGKSRDREERGKGEKRENVRGNGELENGREKVRMGKIGENERMEK